MTRSMARGFLVAAIGVALAPLGYAQEAAKALPTLLIKGEVVSTDTNDPAVSLIKVKDRYGFETPIYVTPTTKITRGGQAAMINDLRENTPVEVEYNFDINTAKRHAANVVIASPSAAAPATPPAPEVPVVPAAPTEAATPAPAASSEPMVSSESMDAAASVSSEMPSTSEPAAADAQ